MHRVYLDVEKAHRDLTYSGGIYDVLGEKLIDIKEDKATTSKLIIDISELLPGNYICRVKIGEEVFMKKLIKASNE